MMLRSSYSKTASWFALGVLLMSGGACGGRSENSSRPPATGASSGGDTGNTSGGGATSDSGGATSGSGGAPDATQACDMFFESFSECAGAEDCPFEDALSPCQAYCLSVRSCAFGDPQATNPEERFGYGDCFTSCDEGFFCASNQVVIERFRICDSRDDCTDGADELDENCQLGVGFTCGERTIARRQVCDGTDDCVDGSDEATCPAFICLDGGSIIPESAACNGVRRDCADGSDEEGCLFP